MPLIPIAAFLAGALLTILMPLALLLALSLWYWVFSVRVPQTTEINEPGTPQNEVSPPGPTIAQNLPAEPGV